MPSPHLHSILAALMISSIAPEVRAASPGKVQEEPPLYRLASNPDTQTNVQLSLLRKAGREPLPVAIQIWTRLWQASASETVRTAALTKLCRFHPHPEELAKLIDPAREREWSDTLRHLAYFPPENKPLNVLKALMPHFRKLPRKAQFMMLSACAQTRDAKTFAPLARQAALGEDEELAATAIATLTAIGTPEDQKLLFKAAFQDRRKAVRKAARNTLQQLTWPDLDQALLKRTQSPDMAVAAIQMLRDRRARQCAPEIAGLIHGTCRQTALAAMNAMADLATEKQLQTMVDAMAEEHLAESARNALEHIVRRELLLRKYRRQQVIAPRDLVDTLSRNIHNHRLKQCHRQTLEQLLRQIRDHIGSTTPTKH